MQTERNSSDRRVRRTKTALRENLLLMLEKTPINKISVSELCGLSDINRSTFYSYYSSPIDLLEEMEREIFAVDLDEDPADDQVFKICKRIYEHKEFCRILFSSHGDTSYLNQQMTMAHDERFQEYRKSLSEEAGSRIEYIFTFFRKGASGVLEQWIQGDFAESPERIAGLIHELGDAVYGLMRVL